ncbi:MAG: hypothetical protein ACT4O3_00485, partial [Elusimicrobiota bacterium]
DPKELVKEKQERAEEKQAEQHLPVDARKTDGFSGAHRPAKGAEPKSSGEQAKTKSMEARAEIAEPGAKDMARGSADAQPLAEDEKCDWAGNTAADA